MKLPESPLPVVQHSIFMFRLSLRKKAKSKNLDGDLYTSTVHSFTYNKDFTVTLSKKFLGPEDKVLLIDDFLAVGKAMRGLIDICKQANAEISGIGIAIEKGFQCGGKELRETGLPGL